MYLVKIGTIGFNADHLIHWDESNTVADTGEPVVLLFFDTPQSWKSPEIFPNRLMFQGDEARKVIAWLNYHTGTNHGTDLNKAEWLGVING